MFSVKRSFNAIRIQALSLSVLFTFYVMNVPSGFAEESERFQHFESQGQASALIELYTSQGCSSCPPAERWFSRLKDDPRLWKTLFPVAFHVDYWDYIGWQDAFAKPEFGKRQRLYERLGYTRNVATPGFVVDGAGWNGWFKGQSLPVEFAVKNRGKLHAKLNISELLLNYEATDTSLAKLFEKGSPKVHVVLLSFDLLVNIQAGENKGKRLSHDFVVREHISSFMLETDQRWQTRVTLPDLSIYQGRTALVVWVSNGDDPKPLQVTGGWL